MREQGISSGLVAAPSIRIRRIRRLPVVGETRVKMGDWVDANVTVASASLPGKLHPVAASMQLGVSPCELQGALRVKEEEAVTKGQVLAEIHRFFGLSKAEVVSPVDGTVLSISPITGQMVIAEADTRMDLPAYLPGTVVAADADGTVEIEAVVSLIQGVFGVGGECCGRLIQVDAWPENEADFRGMNGAETILFSKTPLTYGVMTAMKRHHIAGAVSGSVSGGDLMRFAGRTLNPACTGNEGIGLCIVLTEGFGRLPMAERTFDLLSRISGQSVSVNGATQVRAGVIRPEIIGPPVGDISENDPVVVSRSLAVGDGVRIVRGSLFGKFGRIQSIPAAIQTIGSGAKSLVYEVDILSEGQWTIPRANVEPSDGG